MTLKDYANKKTLGLSVGLILGNIILAGSKLVPVRYGYLVPVLSLLSQLLLSMADKSRSGMTVKQLRLMTKIYKSKGVLSLEPYVRKLTGKELVDLSRVEASRVLDDLLSLPSVCKTVRKQAEEGVEPYPGYERVRALKSPVE